MKYLLFTFFITSCSIDPPFNVYILPDSCGHSVTYNEELKRIEVKVVSDKDYVQICYKRPGHEAFCKVSERTYFNCISLTATNVEGVEVQIDEECIYTL